jgi:hypothetical protein
MMSKRRMNMLNLCHFALAEVKNIELETRSNGWNIFNRKAIATFEYLVNIEHIA